MKPLDPFRMPLTGTSLIEASAGTGKTYTLTTLYLRLLVERGLRVGEILVVTYTHAATAELRERVRKRITEAIAAGEDARAGEALPEEAEAAKQAQALRALAETAAESGKDPLRRALAEFDEAAIFTIHGFCQRTLTENAFESGMPFDAQLVEKAKPLQETLAHDLFHRLLAEQDPGFVRWLVDGPGKRWQFEPHALHDDLLDVLGADEDMPIVPPCPSTEEIGEAGALLAAAAEARREFAASWPTRRDHALALILDTKDIAKKSYTSNNVPKWFVAFDRFAEEVRARGDDTEGVAVLEAPKYLERFTPHALVAVTKDGATTPHDPAFDDIARVMETADAQKAGFEARALWLRHRFVTLARAEADRRRRDLHLFFFDDLLSELRRALRGEAGPRLTALLRERYRYALIDEFQDTDPVQYDVFSSVWHGGDDGLGLALIGDPKQAIYAFRGADVFTYLEARKDAGDNAYGLEVNWRSDPPLIAAVNALFAGPDRAFREEKIAFTPVHERPGFESVFEPGARSKAGLRVLFAERERVADTTGEAQKPEGTMPERIGRTLVLDAVAADIAGLVSPEARRGDRAFEASDVAVLCRTKRELQRMREALERLGLPCVDRGETNVFDTREAWEFACVLRAMMRPADPPTLRGTLATAAHGFDADRIAALSDDSVELSALSEAYAEYGRTWSQRGFARAIEAWRREQGVSLTLLAYRDGERRITNWLHLSELLQRFASERAPSRAGLLAALERAAASEEARAVFGSDAALLRLERDDEAISLVTLHGSKGLQYPVVYLPCLWENWKGKGTSAEGAASGEKRNPPIRFHDREAGRRTLDLQGLPDHIAAKDDEAFSEQLRLLYVGLTRAQHQCVVAWGALGPDHRKSALAWLLLGKDADGGSFDRAASHTAKWTDEDWLAAWARVAEAAGEGSVEIERIDFEAGERWQSRAPSPPPLSWTPPSRRFVRARRTTSFSALTREAHAVAPHAGPEVTGRDRDAAGATLLDVDTPSTEPDLAAEMDAFPRGAEAGTLLHDVLEHVDFATYSAEDPDGPERGARREKVLGLLEAHRMEPERVDQVLHVVEAVATTPLRPGVHPLRLDELPPRALRAEMEFTLWAPGEGGGLEPSALATVLERAPAGSPLARYADRARRLGFQRLNGFLRGYIDAVFHDGERYYLIDYKSNHLGARQTDYAPDALVGPMIDHDYVLQALLYTVALDRHLTACVPGYDYDRDFGGAYYLFLRGLAPSHFDACGVFHDRPPREIVDALQSLLGQGEARRA